MTQHHEGCESEGLYRKYEVRRLDDQTGVHRDCRYFVLDLTHDPAARHAALDYAEQIEATRPTLASDLREAVAGSATPTDDLTPYPIEESGGKVTAMLAPGQHLIRDPETGVYHLEEDDVAGSATPTGDDDDSN